MFYWFTQHRAIPHHTFNFVFNGPLVRTYRKIETETLGISQGIHLCYMYVASVFLSPEVGIKLLCVVITFADIHL